jgi:hypothetical protein
MARNAFTPPDDDDDGDILAALTSGPARSTPALSAPPGAPARTNVHRPAAERATGSQVAAGRPTAPAAPLKRTMKRIGLYVGKDRWLRLKQISLQRAEKGLPDDFTSIFLEALDEKYR